MNPISLILVSARALVRNKLRSFLTVLGVVIGVGAVVAMTTIGAGAKQQIEETFEARGSNMLIVRPGSTGRGGVRSGSGTRSSLTWDDLSALREDLREIRGIAPRLNRRIHINAGGENWGTSVEGVTPEYFELRNWSPRQGSFFTETETERGAKVVVLGETVAEALFPLGDVIGQTVRLDDVPFVVIAVAASKGSSGSGDEDDVAFVPVEAFRARLSRGLGDYLNGRIYIGADTTEAVGRVQMQVETILRTRHKIAAGADDDFRIQNMEDIRAARAEGTNVMTSLLAGIALVSLIVGGIGIMNIMLVSVTERTREIGLRMAVGARPRDLLVQFMMEAVSLSVTGGVIGLLVGLGGAFLLADQFGWNAVLDARAAVLALISSAAVGLFFGLYPAYRASRLNPIQALRFE